MGRRSQFGAEVECSLPWQIELAFSIAGLVCIPAGMWWITNEITSPATMLGEMLGVPIETQTIVAPFKPMIVIFGVIVGWRVRCWLRRTVTDKLNKLV